MLGELSASWHQSDWEDWARSMLDYPSTPRDSFLPVNPRETYPRGQEHAVDDWTNGLKSMPSKINKFWSTPDFSVKRKNLGPPDEPDLEGITGTMYNPIYGSRPPSRGSAGGRSPLKANHDLRLTFPDSDSGFSSSLRTRSGGYGLSSLTDDGFGSPPRSRLMRSRSLSRLSDSCELESPPFSPLPQDTGYRRPNLTGADLIIKGLKDKLEESENRRTVLMSKLKEAQSTLQAQGDRLDRIENTAKENEFVVEGLKVKEQEYRQKIGNLEREQDEKDFLRLENLRLREDMQTRITSLGHQLKTLQSQHCTTEAESSKRTSLLEQTSKALNLLEEENAKFQKERDSAVSEMKTAKDQYHVVKAKFSLVEEENAQIKTTLKKITEEYQALQVSVGESGNKVEELSSLVLTLRNENERLTSTWESTTQEKQMLVEQQDRLEEVLGDLRCQLAEAKQEKDSSLEEKLELKKQHQQLITDKEHLMKSKISLEELLNEQQGEVTAARLNRNRGDEERRRLEEELKAVKKVSEDLSSELSGVKASYERAVEQVNLLENGKRIVNQQQHLLEQEVSRLEHELQNAKDNLQSKEADFRMERNHLEETAQKYKDELRGFKVAKGQAEDKCRELETKLKRANEELQQSVSVQQSELESWRNTCERLTGSVSRKEAELQSLSDKCGDLEDLVSKLKRECKVYEEQLEQCLEAEDMSDRLREDNRRLLQEKAENEQMIQLLEMQKEVLTKSSESNLDRLHEVDQLMGRMDQLRSENTLLRDRIVELEKLRDNLMRQRDDSLVNSTSSVFYSSDSRQGNDQLKTLTEQVDHLQHVNQVLTKNMEKLEQENCALRLRANVSAESVPREKFDRLQRDKSVVENEFSMLQQQHKELTDRHQRFVISYGHNKNDSKTDGECCGHSVGRSVGLSGDRSGGRSGGYSGGRSGGYSGGRSGVGRSVRRSGGHSVGRIGGHSVGHGSVGCSGVGGSVGGSGGRGVGRSGVGGSVGRSGGRSVGRSGGGHSVLVIVVVVVVGRSMGFSGGRSVGRSGGGRSVGHSGVGHSGGRSVGCGGGHSCGRSMGFSGGRSVGRNVGFSGGRIVGRSGQWLKWLMK
ncbi:uncharacterized protein LOC135473565 [Liolophura sinensis]|uniref:uncharacterized protein LOC135473565 n=1 Tax=Liolophura sinensis TaxID=3198878 RepID=UPI003158C473